MTFNELTAHKIRRTLASLPGLSERSMMGGIAFLVEGNMCCGVIDDHLVVRVGPGEYETALREPHARPMDFTGRPLRGFVYVGREGYEAQPALQRWIDRGVEFVRTLPPR